MNSKKKREVSIWPIIFAAVCVSWIWQWIQYGPDGNNLLLWSGIFHLFGALFLGYKFGEEDTEKKLNAKYSDITFDNFNLERENRILKDKLEKEKWNTFWRERTSSAEGDTTQLPK